MREESKHGPCRWGGTTLETAESLNRVMARLPTTSYARRLHREDRRAARRHPQATISFAAAKTRLTARCPRIARPLSRGAIASQRPPWLRARRIGERQARGRTEVRDEHAMRGPPPAMHDHDLGPDREGACRRSVPSAQDGIATAQGQQLLVEAIGRRVGRSVLRDRAWRPGRWIPLAGPGSSRACQGRRRRERRRTPRGDLR